MVPEPKDEVEEDKRRDKGDIGRIIGPIKRYFIIITVASSYNARNLKGI